MRIKNSNTKVFISDIILNILGTGFTAVIIQFIVYPFLNKGTTLDNFGEIIIMMTAVNIVGVLLGNSLNNIRLISAKEYNKEQINGDFSVILFLASIVNIIFMLIIINFLWSYQTNIEKILLVLLSLFTMLRGYLTVDYRLKLNYKKILQHSLVYSFALLIGSFAIFVTEIWQLVFLFGEIVSFVFLYKTTDLLKEPIKVSIKFKGTLKQYAMLSISSSIANILSYLDRIIISALLGSHQVAIFFAATVIGKMSSFIMSPISGVVLSYISNIDRKMTLKIFSILNFGILIFSTIASIFTFYVSKYVLILLYPNYYSESLSILFLANLGIILFASCTLSQTILLKYSPTYLQIVIQISYGFVYLVSGILMINLDGLMGFSIAALIGSVFKFLLIFFIGMVTFRKKEVILL
ncbi:hypothetical protein [Bacillus sp. FJAT-27251]|uniref:lipopolysaccharide biosynthesis protein n=1 Tax=Bacillus sp. FJAT-27251 TaxID=1684142 RepID=UPI0006A7CE00|nr:hypothetical protein [Bacillus sp. FJAT-27251]